MPEKINNPHDLFFKQGMKNKRVLRECFQAHLPEALLQQIDLDSVKLESTDLTDKRLNERRNDVLFSVKMNGQDAFVYFLFEHQSTPDVWIPFRQLEYMVRVWRDYKNRHKKVSVLPVIIPLVFYNGEKQYNVSTDFLSLFGENRALAEEVLFKPFRLIDLTQVSSEMLDQFAWYQIMALVMRFVYDSEQLLDVLESLGSKIMLVEESGDGEYIFSVLEYALCAGNVQDEGRFKRVLDKITSAEMGEQIMTLADRIEERGVQRGMQRGMQRGIKHRNIAIAQNMLKEGLERELIERITGLTESQLATLSLEIEEVN